MSGDLRGRGEGRSVAQAAWRLSTVFVADGAFPDSWLLGKGAHRHVITDWSLYVEKVSNFGVLGARWGRINTRDTPCSCCMENEDIRGKKREREPSVVTPGFCKQSTRVCSSVACKEYHVRSIHACFPDTEVLCVFWAFGCSNQDVYIYICKRTDMYVFPIKTRIYRKTLLPVLSSIARQTPSIIIHLSWVTPWMYPLVIILPVSLMLRLHLTSCGYACSKLWLLSCLMAERQASAVHHRSSDSCSKAVVTDILHSCCLTPFSPKIQAHCEFAESSDTALRLPSWN